MTPDFLACPCGPCSLSWLCHPDSIQKFLQFQLTVNISALTLATIGALYVQHSPLSATQLLWLNLLMDSLASLALATEPPHESQLTRPPVNRSTSIITPRMWWNMLGQAFYQVLVVVGLMFEGHKLAHWELRQEDVADGMEFLDKTHSYSRQYTIIFNTYVLMQLFNEVNCRKLLGESNVFEGISRNPYFVKIWLATIVLQCLFAQFGGAAVGCSDRGLSPGQWLFCVLVSAGTIPWQQVINWVADRALAVVETPGHGGGVMKFGPGKKTMNMKTSMGKASLSRSMSDHSQRSIRLG